MPRACATPRTASRSSGRADAALTPSYEWIDLGEHRFRGLDGEERVYQLAAPALPTEFPPLRTAESRRGRLPQPRTIELRVVHEGITAGRG